MTYDVPPSELHNLGAIQLACSARAPYLARQAVDAWLEDGHPALEIVQLATSELVTNAVTHADAPSTSGRTASDTGAGIDDQENAVTLKLCQGQDYLRLGVTDLGSSCSQPSCIPLQGPSLNAERRRGLPPRRPSSRRPRR
ncbi:hypothetical protein ACWEPC_38875, partial [Nonomuraea sp. NPDC004297]